MNHSPRDEIGRDVVTQEVETLFQVIPEKQSPPELREEPSAGDWGRLLGVIDLSEGRAVYAVGGKRESYRPLEASFCRGGDPLELAAAYLAAGVGGLYVADLDSICRGSRANWGIIHSIAGLGGALWCDLGLRGTTEEYAAVRRVFGGLAERIFWIFPTESLPGSGRTPPLGAHPQEIEDTHRLTSATRLEPIPCATWKESKATKTSEFTQSKQPREPRTTSFPDGVSAPPIPDGVRVPPEATSETGDRYNEGPVIGDIGVQFWQSRRADGLASGSGGGNDELETGERSFRWTSLALAEQWSELSLVAGLDLRDGKVLSPCPDRRSMEPIAVAGEFVAAGFTRLCVIDLASVGMNCGASTRELCQEIRQRFPSVTIIGGGGGRSLADFRSWWSAGCDAVLTASWLQRRMAGAP